MAKPRTIFFCSDCGASAPKWLGKCPQCGEWNTYQEELIQKETTAEEKRKSWAAPGKPESAKAVLLQQVETGRTMRLATPDQELNRVLGGGLVPGSLVLIGGQPGIGKSTLLLQIAMKTPVKVLYVSGEESPQQIALRANRLNANAEHVHVLPETSLGKIQSVIQNEKPEIAVIDSIQTLYSDALTSAPGSVAQVRECAARLTQYAKQSDTAVFLVGHVTKEGGIAGPRVLEHIVDAVLYFEGEVGNRYRVIRAFKNRFGAVNEVGVFAMTDKGLKEVSNPSAIFLSGPIEQRSGSLVMVTREGTRPLLVEVQALVDQSSLGNPRRVAVGFDGNRLAMLLAVLHRHGGVPIYDQDVFVNIVGGIRATETAADLPVLLAVLSSFRDRASSVRTVAFGEVGLAGEIRPVPNGEDRLKEAATHGFQRAIVPKANAPKSGRVGDMEIIAVTWLNEAIEAILRG